MVERAHGGWSEPVRLGSEVNSPGDELYPSVSADGTLYFASGPPFPQTGTDFDIYRAAPRGDRFAPRKALSPGVNTSPAGTGELQDSWEFNPEISADGRTLIFTSLRPGGFGLGDLYVSHYVDGEWTPAGNLGPLVNTAADEYHPTLARNQQDSTSYGECPRGVISIEFLLACLTFSERGRLTGIAVAGQSANHLLLKDSCKPLDSLKVSQSWCPLRRG